ncbi:hypothetical protein HHI36_020859 [Cryptolaemus montrouzieri]|uniref:C2H2-type domain-containing protein n=1 Tax=Cryptolaemus montrouzieri TaxID=559131 RepID=A0ABD2NCL4_9CUCU
MGTVIGEKFTNQPVDTVGKIRVQTGLKVFNDEYSKSYNQEGQSEGCLREKNHTTLNENEEIIKIEENFTFMDEFIGDNQQGFVNLENSVKMEVVEESDCTARETFEAYIPSVPNERNIIDDGVRLKMVKYECSKCEYQVTEKSDLREHIESVHSNLKEFKCIHCDYTAIRRGLLLQHKNEVHLGVKNYKCTKCDYQTSRRSEFKIHTNSVHLNIRNHKCNICDFSTSRKYVLTKHLTTTHMKIKNHKCDYCDYQASQMDNLQKHVDSIHLGIKITTVGFVIISE